MKFDNVLKENNAMKAFVAECKKSKTGFPSNAWIKNNEDAMEVVRNVWLKGLGNTGIETPDLEISF